MFEIAIYDNEKDIADQLKASCVISSLASIESVEPFQVPKSLNKLTAAELSSFDLYFLKSILFTSDWNGNDELFLASEVWNARNTAKDKPFNYEHVCDDIIGHTTDSYIIDNDGKVIESANGLPDLIHVVSKAVLYKSWSKKDKQERMQKILGEILEGKWCVSVECLFPNFDYALKDDSGKIEIISRNKETSFLTKHLRMFNGKGVFDGKQLGRVPRNFIVSGKGLVEKPANKASVILAHKLISQNVLNTDSSKELVYISYDNKEVKKMDNSKELEYQKQVNELQASLKTLQASVAESEVNKIKIELEKTQKEAEAKIQEINALKGTLDKANADKIELTKVTEEIVKVKNDLEKQFNELVEAKKIQARLHSVQTELKMSDDHAKTFVDNTNKLSDEAFNSLVTLQKNFSVNSVVVKETVKIDEIGTQKVLEKVNEPNLSINVANPKEDLIKLQASVVEFMEKNNYKKLVEKNKFSPSK